jgi:symplekin
VSSLSKNITKHDSNTVCRSQSGGPLSQIISDTLATQGVRMDRASADEKARKLAAASGSSSSSGPSTSTAAAAEDPSLKRPTSENVDGAADAKRPKLDASTTASAAALLAAFDFTSLPASLITEIIVSNLGAFTEPTLVDLVQRYREEHLKPAVTVAAAASTSTPAPATVAVAAAMGAPADAGPSTSTDTPVVAPDSVSASAEKEVIAVKEEPVDPLQMDIDEDELDFEPDKLNHKVNPVFTHLYSH